MKKLSYIFSLLKKPGAVAIKPAGIKMILCRSDHPDLL